MKKDITFMDDQELLISLTGVAWDAMTPEEDYPPFEEQDHSLSFCAEDFGGDVISTVKCPEWIGSVTHTINQEDVLDHALQWLSKNVRLHVTGVKDMTIEIADPHPKLRQ